MSSAPSLSAYGVAARPIPSDLDICYRLSIFQKEAIADVQRPSLSAYGVAARPIPSDLDICYRLSIFQKEAIAGVY